MSWSFEAFGRARGVAAAARAAMATNPLPIEAEEKTRQALLGEIATTGETLPAETVIKASAHGSAWSRDGQLFGTSSKFEIETPYGFLENPAPAVEEPVQQIEQPAAVEEPEPPKAA